MSSACILIFGQNGDAVEFDAVTPLSPSMTADVTEYPIESGAILADSMILRPREWTFTGYVSDTPLRPNMFPLLGNGQIRSAAVWHRLQQAMQQRQPCEYQDDLDQVPVCAITSVSTSRTADTAGSLVLQITLRELLIATVQVIARRIVTHTGQRRNNGTKTAVQASPAAELKVGDQVVATLNATGQYDQATNIAVQPQQQTLVPTLQSSSPGYSPAATNAPIQPSIFDPTDVSPAVEIPQTVERTTWS